MFTANEYVMPASLEEAYQILTSKKANCILGGCAWLRLGKKRINTAIDLSKCNLDFIREDDDCIEIGAMTSYRSVETSEILKNNFGGVVADCVSSILGTQFRNTVTVGGSVYARFGFSDFLTPLLALNTSVVLYHQGSVSLADFMKMPYEKDIIEKIVIKKDVNAASYQMFRNSRGDFPILNLAVSVCDSGKIKVTVGARGPKAVIAEKTSEYLTAACENGAISDDVIIKAHQLLLSEVAFTTNMRASAEYRQIVAGSLLKKAIKEVMAC